MIEELDEKELAMIDELDKYENKWVAIVRNGDEENVVGSGESIKDAKHAAEAQGFQDVVFLKVPSSHEIFIPMAPFCCES